MAQNGRFGLSVRVLNVLAGAPGKMHTSTAIAEQLGTSPVMVRRLFSALGAAGYITQRKGPLGGARLKIAAKEIGLGDLYAAVGGAWPASGEKVVDSTLARLRKDAERAMNETTLANVAKKLGKAKASAE